MFGRAATYRLNISHFINVHLKAKQRVYSTLPPRIRREAVRYTRTGVLSAGGGPVTQEKTLLFCQMGRMEDGDALQSSD